MLFSKCGPISQLSDGCFFVSYYHGTTSVGWYTVAVSLAQMLWLLSGAFALVLFPNVASLEIKQRLKYTKVRPNVPVGFYCCAYLSYTDRAGG